MKSLKHYKLNFLIIFAKLSATYLQISKVRINQRISLSPTSLRKQTQQSLNAY